MKDAITISVKDGLVSTSYEPKTSENIARKLNQLKMHLGVTWYGVAEVLGLQPTEGSVRLFKRWARDPSMSSYREMPENQWKLLLAIVDGQSGISNVSMETSNRMARIKGLTDQMAKLLSEIEYRYTALASFDSSKHELETIRTEIVDAQDNIEWMKLEFEYLTKGYKSV